eukprot:m.153874 g.153874  ORF g.153874 m.153874 type:complete len:287 (-) comp30857_c1_seq3:2218-3078(-)
MNLILLQLEDFIERLERRQKQQHREQQQHDEPEANNSDVPTIDLPHDGDEGDIVEIYGVAEVNDTRRVNHIHTVLKSELGDVLKVGELNGWIGTGTILSMDTTRVRISISLTQKPAPPSSVTLIIALPEPKDIFLKILHHATVLGVKRFYIINATNVPIGYWGSHSTQRNTIRDMLCLGLEQTIDTVLPEVFLRRDTERFINTELPEIMKHATNLLIARQPSIDADVPHKSLQDTQAINLIVGPQPNFTEPEENVFVEMGFERVTFGRRVLPVLALVNVMLGRLSL